METGARHRCVIYNGSPAKHLRSLAVVMKRQLRSNYRCLYLNSPAMVAGIRSYLSADHVDVAEEVSRGALVVTSDQGHLVDGAFDIDRMLEMLKEAAAKAIEDGFEGLWASGDMTWELGGEKNFEKLLEYEYRLDEFLNETPTVGGICQYHAETLPAEMAYHALHTHQEVFINETLSRLNPHYAARGMAIGPIADAAHYYSKSDE